MHVCIVYLCRYPLIVHLCVYVGPPAIVIAPAGINAPAVIGAKVTFGCVSEGSPPPPIEWKFNDNVEITTVSYRIITLAYLMCR